MLDFRLFVVKSIEFSLTRFSNSQLYIFQTARSKSNSSMEPNWAIWLKFIRFPFNNYHCEISENDREKHLNIRRFSLMK